MLVVLLVISPSLSGIGAPTSPGGTPNLREPVSIIASAGSELSLLSLAPFSIRIKNFEPAPMQNRLGVAIRLVAAFKYQITGGEKRYRAVKVRRH